MRRILVLLLIAAFGIFAGRAMAQQVLPQGFFGTFTGLGLSETMQDNKIVQVKPRDFDVTIAPSDNGFTISWKTTVYTIRPGHSRLNSDDESITFVKSARPGLFGEKTPGNLAAGEPAYWARITNNTLDVYRLSVDDDGRHELAVWQRVLNGDRMDLIFQRSGETTKPRVVKGTLSRVKP